MKRRKGRVYILRVGLRDDDTVYKIGLTQRAIQFRMQEILMSFYSKYKYFPRIEILRGHEKGSLIANFKGVEAHLLWMYKSQKIVWQKKFNGSSEFVRIDSEDKLLKDYDKTVKDMGSHVEELGDALNSVKQEIKDDGLRPNANIESKPMSGFACNDLMPSWEKEKLVF